MVLVFEAIITKYRIFDTHACILHIFTICQYTEHVFHIFHQRQSGSKWKQQNMEIKKRENRRVRCIKGH